MILVAGSTSENPPCAVILTDTLHLWQSRQWKARHGFGCMDSSVDGDHSHHQMVLKICSLIDAFRFAFPLVSFSYKYHCFPSILQQISRRGSGACFEALLLGVIGWEFS